MSQRAKRSAMLLGFFSFFLLAVFVSSAEASSDAKCRKKRLALFAKAIRAEANCYGRAIAQEGQVDPQCLLRAAAKLEAVWKKNDARGGCDEQSPEFLSNVANLVGRTMEEAVSGSGSGMSAAADGNQVGPPRLIFSAPFCTESPPELPGGGFNLAWVQQQILGPLGNRCVPQPKDASFLWNSAYIDKGDAGSLCQAIAEQVYPAAMNVGWDVWVSTAESSPVSRFQKSTGPYQLPSGIVVANDWSDLTDGVLENPVDEDIFGNPTSSSFALTATTAAGEFSGKDCDGWQNYSLLSQATRGDVAAVDSTWAEKNEGSCDAMAADGLICVQQDGSELVEKLPPPDRLTFFVPFCASAQTKTDSGGLGPWWPLGDEELADGCWPNLVDGGYLSGDAPYDAWMAFVVDQGWAGGHCEQLAQDRGLVDESAGFDIWFSTANSSPSSRFLKGEGNYVLPSGVTVANGWLDLADSSLDNPINENIDAVVFPSRRVLTGSTREGSPAETCSNWTNYTNDPLGPSTQAAWGLTDGTDGSWSDSFPPMACTDTLGFAEMGFYCFQQSGAAPTVPVSP